MNKKLPAVAVEVEERGSLNRDRQERKKGKKYCERREVEERGSLSRDRQERDVLWKKSREEKEGYISDYFLKKKPKFFFLKKTLIVAFFYKKRALLRFCLRVASRFFIWSESFFQIASPQDKKAHKGRLALKRSFLRFSQHWLSLYMICWTIFIS